MDVEEYQKKIKIAKETVEHMDLDDNLRINAFNTILKSLLEKEDNKKENISKSSQMLKKQDKKEGVLDFSIIPYFENFENLSWKEKILNILAWAKENNSSGGLLTSEIVLIFHERFGIKYVDSPTINKEMNRRLLKTPYVTRKKIDQKSFRWFITSKGEMFLKGDKNG